MSSRRRPRPRAEGALELEAARLPGPERTCVGCRATAAKPALLRVVVVDGHLAVDPAGRLPGRGASVHRDPRCVELAEKRRAFPRALRQAGPLDVTPVIDYVTKLNAPPAHPSDESRLTAP